MHRIASVRAVVVAFGLLAGCGRVMVEHAPERAGEMPPDAGPVVEDPAAAGGDGDTADLGLDRSGSELDADPLASAETVSNLCVAPSGGGGFSATACGEDADCEAVTLADYRLLRCNPSVGKCGQCTTNADCTSPARPVCAIHLGDLALCSACDADSDCAKGSGNTGLCSEAKRCDRCLVDQDCLDAGLGALCRYGSCYPCSDDADCVAGPGNTGKCRLNHCNRCTTDADCLASGLGVACNPWTERCLQCQKNSDCVASAQTTRYCYENECQGCEVTADCQILSQDHRCFPVQ